MLVVLCCGVRRGVVACCVVPCWKLFVALCCEVACCEVLWRVVSWRKILTHPGCLHHPGNNHSPRDARFLSQRVESNPVLKRHTHCAAGNFFSRRNCPPARFVFHTRGVLPRAAHCVNDLFHPPPSPPLPHPRVMAGTRLPSAPRQANKSHSRASGSRRTG